MPLSLPDLSSPSFKANPFPIYARMRDEAPVFRVELRDGPAWLVTRHEGCERVLKEPRLSKDMLRMRTNGAAVARRPAPRFVRPFSRQLLGHDPPNHTRLRALVSKAFTSRLIEGMRPRIQKLADEQLDAIERSGDLELIRDYALPIPVTIIAEMLGIPHEDRHKFTRWSRKLVALTSAADFFRALPSMWAFQRYLRKLFERRRNDTGDDLTVALLRAEESGDQLNEDELLAMIFILLIAGHETTVNLIATGSLALLEPPSISSVCVPSPR